MLPTWLADRRRATAAAVGLAAALTLPSLFVGLAQDDLTLWAFATGHAEHPLGQRAPWDLFRFFDSADTVAHMRDRGFTPWWTSDGLRLAFLRPLTSLSHVLDFRLFGDRWALHHAVSVAMYAAAAAAVAALYRRIGGPHPERAAIAGAAGVLWALDDAHGMPVGWLANRNAVLAWGLSAAALAAHDRWRRDPWPAGAVAAPMLTALALSAGETALGLFGYLTAYAWFLDRRRLWTLAPHLAVLAGWAALYVAGGYGASGSVFYVDPLADPLGFAAVLPGRLLTLVGALLGPIWADAAILLPPSAWGAHFALTAASAALVGSWLWPVVRATPRGAFWACGALAACVPVCATWPTDRLLGIAGFGAFALIAERLTTAPRGVRAALLFVHVGLAAPFLALKSLAIGQPDAEQRAAAESLAPVGAREVVVVWAPNWFVPAFGAQRMLIAQPDERFRLRMLTTGGRPEVERAGPSTLVLRAAEGEAFFATALDRVVRDGTFAAGARTTVGAWTYEVRRVDADGFPTELVVTAPTPLDDPARVWVTWDGAGLAPVRP